MSFVGLWPVREDIGRATFRTWRGLGVQLACTGCGLIPGTSKTKHAAPEHRAQDPPSLWKEKAVEGGCCPPRAVSPGAICRPSAVRPQWTACPARGTALQRGAELRLEQCCSEADIRVPCTGTHGHMTTPCTPCVVDTCAHAWGRQCRLTTERAGARQCALGPQLLAGAKVLGRMHLGRQSWQAPPCSPSLRGLPCPSAGSAAAAGGLSAQRSTALRAA